MTSREANQTDVDRQPAAASRWHTVPTTDELTQETTHAETLARGTSLHAGHLPSTARWDRGAERSETPRRGGYLQSREWSGGVDMLIGTGAGSVGGLTGRRWKIPST